MKNSLQHLHDSLDVGGGHHRTLSSQTPNKLGTSPHSKSNEKFLVGEIQSLKEAITDLYLAIKIRSAEEVSVFKSVECC